MEYKFNHLCISYRIKTTQFCNNAPLFYSLIKMSLNSKLILVSGNPELYNV